MQGKSNDICTPQPKFLSAIETLLTGYFHIFKKCILNLWHMEWVHDSRICRAWKYWERKMVSAHWSAARNEGRPSSRGWTIHQPDTNRPSCSWIRFKWGLMRSTPRGKVQNVLSSQKQGVVPWAIRSAQPLFCPTLPRPVPSCQGLRRPAGSWRV